MECMSRSRYAEKALRDVPAGDVAAAVTILSKWGAKARAAPDPADVHAAAGVIMLWECCRALIAYYPCKPDRHRWSLLMAPCCNNHHR